MGRVRPIFFVDPNVIDDGNSTQDVIGGGDNVIEIWADDDRFYAQGTVQCTTPTDQVVFHYSTPFPEAASRSATQIKVQDRSQVQVEIRVDLDDSVTYFAAAPIRCKLSASAKMAVSPDSPPGLGDDDNDHAGAAKAALSCDLGDSYAELVDVSDGTSAPTSGQLSLIQSACEGRSDVQVDVVGGSLRIVHRST